MVTCLLRKHPFEYEQRAFHFLLGTPQWTSRGLRKYQHQGQGQGSAPLSEAFIRSHFHMFPQVTEPPLLS